MIFEIEKSRRKSIDVTNKSLDEQEDLKKREIFASYFNVQRPSTNSKFFNQDVSGKMFDFFSFSKTYFNCN